MTAKDYVALAAALARAKPLLPDGARPTVNDLRPHPRVAGAYEAWINCCKRVGDACAINPRFDRNLFLKNCGVTP